MGVDPTTFRPAATDDDKDQRLYRTGHNSLSLYNIAYKIDFIKYISSNGEFQPPANHTMVNCDFLSEMQCVAFSPIAIIGVCVRECLPRWWTSGKQFEINPPFIVILQNTQKRHPKLYLAHDHFCLRLKIRIEAILVHYIWLSRKW